MPVVGDRFSKSWVIASRPPAEAPMATMVKGFLLFGFTLELTFRLRMSSVFSIISFLTLAGELVVASISERDCFFIVREVDSILWRIFIFTYIAMSWSV